MGFLRKLLRWRFALIAAIILVAVVAAFLTLRGSSTREDAEIPEDQQVIPVKRGDLIQEISISGSLSLPDRETLSFGSSGIVAEIMIAEGDKVSAGQTLAILDREDIAALEESVIQAQVALRDSEEAAQEYRSPSELDIARARKGVRDAEVNLQNAQDALEGFVEPSEVSISEIESRIVGYEVELDRIAEDIENLQEPPTQLQIDQAKKNISATRLDLERAQDTLENALEGADPNDIENAQNAVASARRELDSAQSDLELAQRDRDDNLSDSRSRVSDISEDYAKAFSKWLGITGDPNQFHPDYEVALSDLGVNLDALFDLSARFADLEEGGYYSDGIPPDDPSTAWDEPTVFLWLNLNPTNLAVTCDPGDTTHRGACIQEEFRAPSEVYVAALDDLADLEAQANRSVSSAETALERAELALKVAENALEDLTEPPEPTAVSDMEAAIQLAKSRLSDAEETLSELLEPEDVSLALENLNAQAKLARASLRQAEEDMAELLSGKDKPEYASLLQDIEVARLDLDEKRQDLEDLIERDPESLDQVALDVKVAAAKVSLSQAQERLTEATIIAPFDGFVAKLDAEEGDEVERHTNIMVVVDTTVVELTGGVDEIDVLETRVGAKASIEVDALPDQPLNGEVFSIASEPDSGQGGGRGIVSYPVRIRLTVPDDVDLPAGLSAIASIVISEERDALLVPLDALRGSFDNPTLHVMVDGEIVETPVALGSSDEFWTIVTDGVSEGDMIVTKAPEGSEGEFDIGSGPD